MMGERENEREESINATCQRMTYEPAVVSRLTEGLGSADSQRLESLPLRYDLTSSLLPRGKHMVTGGKMEHRTTRLQKSS